MPGESAEKRDGNAKLFVALLELGEFWTRRLDLEGPVQNEHPLEDKDSPFCFHHIHHVLILLLGQFYNKIFLDNLNLIERDSRLLKSNICKFILFFLELRSRVSIFKNYLTKYYI